MSILETLTKIKDSGFDPLKDAINGSGGLLPSGKYPVTLKSAQHGATRGGNEQVAVTLEVASGEHKGRKEIIFLSLEPTLPEFVVDTNAKILLAIIELADIQCTREGLEDYHSMAETLRGGIGKQFMMDLKIRENKSNPQYPYRNYELSPLPEIEDDLEQSDLPF